MRLLVGQLDLIVIPHIAGEGAVYDTTDITNMHAIAAARVSQGSHTLENSSKWPFQGKSGKSQGIYQAPQGICENHKISDYSQGMAMADLSAASENVT